MDAKARRRWLGAIALVLAVAMLVLGETLLQGKLGLLALAVYWFVCMLLTLAAVFAALLDARATAQASLREQRALLDSTLQKIQAEALERPDPRHNGGTHHRRSEQSWKADRH